MDERWWLGHITAATHDPEHYLIEYEDEDEDEDDLDPWSSFKHIDRIRPWNNTFGFGQDLGSASLNALSPWISMIDDEDGTTNLWGPSAIRCASPPY